uniref:Regucalcin n=1 Tax=Photinus pyralis TaxID=7054 RepID=Q95YI4_PHOPY
MGPVVEKIAELGKYTVGEGPHWDHETQTLYFVDTVEKTFHKYVPSQKKYTFCKVDKLVSFIIPLAGSPGRFVVSLEREIAILTWDGVSAAPTSIEAIVNVEPHIKNNRLNDGKADPLGNLWTGTMAIDAGLPVGPVTGSLYHLGADKKVKMHESNIAIANGLAWSNDLKKMYYIDSGKRRVDEYDYDASTLSISNQRPLFTFEKHEVPGYPDGQTIDEEGNLWVAVFQGQRIIKISTQQPEVLLDTVKIPDPQVTSVAFGGPNLDELHVTSAGLQLDDSSLDKSLVNGHVYRVTGLGVKGFAGVKVKL